MLYDNYTPIKKQSYWDAWVAQSVKHPALAQVMISRFMSSSPASGSLLAAWSPLQVLCPSLSLCPSPYSHLLSLSQK